ncbi:MAG: carbohydrate-binding family 9-like protein [Alphaproteobacteria bacterium]|uniref:Carbohydrate-binding family 9-like protein n=1 Tax=Candidatus Nitrobium versatile TaxID=2884831 RepID=A0A953LVV4_9BACT|nr:carbohydrate-binding family 9-like protein [Candidatus Nitrobium versatile]
MGSTGETGREYVVQRARARPEMKGAWDGFAWNGVEFLEVACFRPESSVHRPRTRVKLLYDDDGLFGIFSVEDRYIRCVHSRYMDPVYRDSCVEFFVRSRADTGYFNFEFNCGGALLCSYITDPTRTSEGFREYAGIPERDGRQVEIYHSMPAFIDPEIAEAVSWTLEFFIPFSLLEKYTGPLGELPGTRWRANFYKCGDGTSHPHWAAWSPVDALNFHLPHCFGTLLFR